MPNKNWLPWRDMLAFALGRLKRSPTEFWQMSLLEFDAAIDGYFGKSASQVCLKRDEFNQLALNYPDTELENHEHK